MAGKVRSETGFTGGAKGSALVACWESLQERGCSRQKGGSGQAQGKYAGNWVRGSEWLKHGLQGAERGWDRGWGHADGRCWMEVWILISGQSGVEERERTRGPER